MNPYITTWAIITVASYWATTLVGAIARRESRPTRRETLPAGAEQAD